MTNGELDEVYTALARAITAAGEARAPLLLAMLSLDLLSRQDGSEQALASIRRAEEGLAA